MALTVTLTNDNSVVSHVIRVQGNSCGSVLGYLRRGFLEHFLPYNLINMSLSGQHPYAMFIAGGLRSPSLAKA